MEKDLVEIKRILSKGDCAKAVSEMKILYGKDSKRYKNFPNIEFRFQALQNSYVKGTISQSDYLIELNRINDSLLLLISEENSKPSSQVVKRLNNIKLRLAAIVFLILVILFYRECQTERVEGKKQIIIQKPVDPIASDEVQKQTDKNLLTDDSNEPTVIGGQIASIKRPNHQSPIVTDIKPKPTLEPPTYKAREHTTQEVLEFNIDTKVDSISVIFEVPTLKTRHTIKVNSNMTFSRLKDALLYNYDIHSLLSNEGIVYDGLRLMIDNKVIHDEQLELSHLDLKDKDILRVVPFTLNDLRDVSVEKIIKGSANYRIPSTEDSIEIKLEIGYRKIKKEVVVPRSMRIKDYVQSLLDYRSLNKELRRVGVINDDYIVHRVYEGDIDKDLTFGEAGVEDGDLIAIYTLRYSRVKRSPNYPKLLVARVNFGSSLFRGTSNQRWSFQLHTNPWEDLDLALGLRIGSILTEKDTYTTGLLVNYSYLTINPGIMFFEEDGWKKEVYINLGLQHEFAVGALLFGPTIEYSLGKRHEGLYAGAFISLHLW